MGIEPTLSAWEAEVLPLNYTRFVYNQTDEDWHSILIFFNRQVAKLKKYANFFKRRNSSS